MEAPAPRARAHAAPVGAASLPQVRPRTRGLRFRLRALGIGPALRLAALAAVLGVSHLAGALGDRLRPAARRAGRREARQARAAARVVRSLGRLRGSWVKLGQFAALRYDVLPEPWRAGLASLQDRVEPQPFERIRARVELELGAPLETLFSEFDPVPLGTASLAQAHRARLPGGEEVAVKVQHPGLEEALPGDLALLRRLTAAWARRGRGRLDAQRLVEEFAAGLREELDFEREARVAAELAANLAFEPGIVVPAVVASHSTRRVLTMEYRPAVRIDDRAALIRLGVAPRAVLEILARGYAKQIFVDGLFHADPHPGNLFVLDEPQAASRPRVLFVDFGLSRRLAPELRRELRRGLLAVLQGDVPAFLAGMDRMGMVAPGGHAAVEAAVRAMFERLRGEGAPLGLAGERVLALKDEAKRLLQETEGLQLPNDLLLYAKTLSYLFALGSRLDPELDLMRLALPYLLRFLAEPEDAAAGLRPAGAEPGAGPAGG